MSVRIGWVTLKASGARVRALPKPEAPGINRDMVAEVAEICRLYPNLRAYAFIAIADDVTTVCNWGVAEGYPINVRTLPAYLSQELHSHMVRMATSENIYFGPGA